MIDSGNAVAWRYIQPVEVHGKPMHLWAHAASAEVSFDFFYWVTATSERQPETRGGYHGLGALNASLGLNVVLFDPEKEPVE